MQLSVARWNGQRGYYYGAADVAVSVVVFQNCLVFVVKFVLFFSSRRRHTRCSRDWSSDVCSSDLVRGPVKAQAASGAIRVEKIERNTQLTTLSGTVSATDIGNDVRVSSASGSVTVSNTRGDVRVNALSGDIRISHPGGRIEADTASGEVEIQGAASDVQARAASGRVSVQGNPGADSYWELRTVSGTVQLGVPASANLHLSAEAVSGEIRTDIPIVIEEQGKHSLRAHMGSGGGRVDVHTVTGEIRMTGTK